MIISITLEMEQFAAFCELVVGEFPVSEKLFWAQVPNATR